MHLEIRQSLAEQGTGQQEDSPKTRNVDSNALTGDLGVCLLDSPSISVACRMGEALRPSPGPGCS